MFISRRLLNDPNMRASRESGLARSGSIGGCFMSDAVSFFVVCPISDISSAVKAVEYTGGLELAKPLMIGSGGRVLESTASIG